MGIANSHDTIKRKRTVLLVEDNEADRRLLQRVLKKNLHETELQFAQNGEIALSMLRDVAIPRPDLILMDINMPKMNGKQVLLQIRNDPQLRLIPVIILTTSSQEIDIEESYLLGANAFIVKPVDIEAFEQLTCRFEQFWFFAATLPKV